MQGACSHGQPVGHPQPRLLAVELARAVSVELALQVGISLDELVGEPDRAPAAVQRVGNEVVVEQRHLRHDVVVMERVDP